MKTMKLIPIFLTLMILASCGPQKRLNRLLDNHPYLAQKDTVKQMDTVKVTVPGVQSDSSFSITHLENDTVYIHEKQLKIKTFIHNDTVFISGECDTITKTVIREVKIPYDKFIYKKNDSWRWYHWLLLGIGILCFTFIIVNITDFIKSIRK